MTLNHYLKYEPFYVALLVTTLMLINNSINATSILMEAKRSGTTLVWWHPFVTEYSSALSFVLLFPVILWLLKRFPLQWKMPGRRLAAHFFFSIGFSVSHIVLFVMLRNLVFSLQGVDYVYSEDFLESFVYEYRKDAWVYCLTIAGCYSYRFILSRLRGEAVPVADGEEAAGEQVPERFLVRKLGKEFVVNADDVEWLEAAGNYVNLHVGEKVYPLRSTMSRLLDALTERGFARIHRSRGINLNYVESITPLESGDCTVALKSGKQLSMSRRYRDNFRQQFAGR